MRLTDAVLMSSKGIAIISSHTNNRYEPAQVNAKRLGDTSAVFDNSSGITEEEKKGFWGFIV